MDRKPVKKEIALIVIPNLDATKESKLVKADAPTSNVFHPFSKHKENPFLNATGSRAPPLTLLLFHKVPNEPPRAYRIDRQVVAAPPTRPLKAASPPAARELRPRKRVHSCPRFAYEYLKPGSSKT